MEKIKINTSKLQQGGQKVNTEKAVEIAEGIFWVGYNDEKNGLHSNPYLIFEGDEGLLIDGGSRPDFSSVMMKILQTGILPSQIIRLLYHHYDPDLAGSVSNFESIINNPDLEIISQNQNNIFIEHYSAESKMNCINRMDNVWEFKSGRRLQFINTPYVHSPGSFITYDEKTKTLFTSDIFGAYGMQWDLFMDVQESCRACSTYNTCQSGKARCFMPGVIKFHQIIMTSNKSLRIVLDKIRELDIEIIAPQHGSLIKGAENIEIVLEKLYKIDNIGIDGVLINGDRHIW